MALDTYSNLKAAVKRWSKRSDIDDLLDDFIDICETEIYKNTVEPLRINSMVQLETSATSTSLRTQALPTGYLSMRRFDLTIGDDRRIINYVTPSAQVIRPDTSQPVNYTITSQIEYDIIPNLAYVTNILYYGKLTALSDSNTTNDILTNYSDIYLYGSLAVAFQYYEDDEQAAKYKALFIAAINGANTADSEGNRGVASRKQTGGRTP